MTDLAQDILNAIARRYAPRTNRPGQEDWRVSLSAPDAPYIPRLHCGSGAAYDANSYVFVVFDNGAVWRPDILMDASIGGEPTEPVGSVDLAEVIDEIRRTDQTAVIVVIRQYYSTGRGYDDEIVLIPFGDEDARKAAEEAAEVARMTARAHWEH